MELADLFTLDRLQVPDYTKPWSPATQEQRSLQEPGWTWKGVIIARAWDPGFTEAEYLLKLAAGNRNKLKGYERTRDGAPLLFLSSLDQKEKERLLNQDCLGIAWTSNIACNAGRGILLQFVTNAGGLTGVQYFAVGTGAGTPAAADTQLFTEFFRKAITSTSISGNQANISTFFATTDANTTYSEAGIFGNGATGTANSGTLFAHASYVYTKTNSVSLTNDYIITLN